MATIRRQSGFTLVEIAIVLVIIGLLLGGILKGQEMITQARIKNVINDFNGISAAYFSYQDRYRAIPGDDQGAEARWSGGTAALVGQTSGTSANGTVDGNWNAATGGPPEAESRLFWWHLRLAGFIPGPTTPASQGSSQPTNAFGSLIGVQTGTGAATVNLSGLIVCSSGIPDKVAIAVDTQMDDQGSNTGSVRAMQTGGTPALGAAAANYQETGSLQYIVCKGV
jgi:prepilin-type N-terminal cleavage/methylation domain-containing protein